jgi:hypothetical protein
MTKEILRFAGDMAHDEAADLAKEIVGKIDWDNEALMHKGFTWIAKTYLSQMACAK